jgi:hypothetical protein
MIAYSGAVDTLPSTAARVFPHPGVRFIPLEDAAPTSLALVTAASTGDDDTIERFRQVVFTVIDQHLNIVPGAVSLRPTG